MGRLLGIWISNSKFKFCINWFDLNNIKLEIMYLITVGAESQKIWVAVALWFDWAKLNPWVRHTDCSRGRIQASPCREINGQELMCLGLQIFTRGGNPCLLASRQPSGWSHVDQWEDEGSCAGAEAETVRLRIRCGEARAALYASMLLVSLPCGATA